MYTLPRSQAGSFINSELFSCYRPISGSATMYRSIRVIDIFFREKGGPPVLQCRIIKAASKPLNHFSFVLKLFPEVKCPIFTMSVVAMGRTFVLMSHGPSARLNLDFDKTRQCLNLIQSTFLFLKRRLMPKVEFSRSWCAQKQAAWPMVCGTPAPHTLSPVIFAH